MIRGYNSEHMEDVSKAGRPYKILIIEDDATLGSLINQKLNDEGFETRLAPDGLEGLKKIKEFGPDLILLDIILPSLNGYQVLEEKNKDEAIRDIPVVVISNSGQPVEIQKALDLGVKDYLVKSDIPPEEVLLKVRTELKKMEDEKTKTQQEEGVRDESGLEKFSVLIVEDDKFLIDLLIMQLSKQKFKAYHAKDGEEAIKIANEKKPNLILLDIILPGMNGFEIIEQLKKGEITKDIPVIFMSNLGDKEDIEKGKSLGAKDFIVKANFSLDEIMEKIKEELL